MKILILGGAGMVGQKLLAQLINQNATNTMIDEIILHDIVEPRSVSSSTKITSLTGNCADQQELKKLAQLRPDVIYHLAAIVSGDAERNFEKGWDINAHGLWHFLEALRAEHETTDGSYKPRLIFTSSIAVFGGPYPDVIDDEFLVAPQSSYGAQKAMGEILVSEYSRKGFIDGFSLRLPTISVRPGKPNLAASSFLSGIIREPLNGQRAVLPVSPQARHWLASPRSAARSLASALSFDTARLENRRTLNLPGISCSVEEQLDALKKVAGSDILNLIDHQRDEAIERIVKSWPPAFDTTRAQGFGFSADTSYEEIIQAYIKDDLNA